MRTILTLSNVNVNNHYAMDQIVAHAGYKGSLRIIDLDSYSLDLGTEESRKAAGITEQEVKLMIGELIMYTSVKVESKVTA